MTVSAILAGVCGGVAFMLLMWRNDPRIPRHVGLGLLLAAAAAAFVILEVMS